MPMPALPPDERKARRRESRRVYQGDHYATVSASVPIDDKIRFDAVCRAAGSSMHREICGFVARRLGYLPEDPPIGSPEDPPIGSPEDPPIGSPRTAFATPPVIFL